MNYAGTFATNKVTIVEMVKIQGVNTDGIINVNFRNVRFTYVDVTKVG